MTNSPGEYCQVVCSHCEGEGCLYCDKTGRVSVKTPACRCQACEGIGCIYCGFTGWAGLKGKYE